MPDDLDDLLGIDRNDPIQQLAIEQLEADEQLLRDLVAWRNAQRLTQAEVGQRMGVTQPAVAAFERADADPKLSTVRRYALAVGALVRHSVTDPARSATRTIQHSSAVTKPVGQGRARITRAESSSLVAVS